MIQNSINFSLNSNVFFDNLETELKEVILNKELIDKLLNEQNEVFYAIKIIFIICTFYCQFAMNYLYIEYENNQEQFIKEYNKWYKNYLETAKTLDSDLENLNINQSLENK